MLRNTILVALASAIYASAALTVSSPQINQCKDVTFQVGGASGQVWFNFLPSVNPCSSDAIDEVGPIDVSSGSYTWHNANIAAGTSIVVVVDDASGAEAWSSIITVGGSSADCAASTSASRTIASVNNQIASSTHHSSATQAPVNAAGSTDAPTSGALNVQASWATSLLALIAGAAIIA